MWVCFVKFKVFAAECHSYEWKEPVEETSFHKEQPSTSFKKNPFNSGVLLDHFVGERLRYFLYHSFTKRLEKTSV